MFMLSEVATLLCQISDLVHCMLDGGLQDRSGEVLSERILKGEQDVCWAGACKDGV